MKTITIGLFLSTFTAVGSAAPTLAGRDTANSTDGLYVTEAPQFLRPYVLPKNYGQTARLGNQVYRFSVTGNSSAGAFTLMQTNAPESNALGVLPHLHETHYENFFCAKGRVQLWTQSNLTADTEQNTRILTQGDYGAVPHNTTHTFQLLDPDTQLTGVIQPGGFEALFLALADGTYESAIGSSFIPANISQDAGGDPSVITALEAFDVYAQLDFTPRQDAVDGFAGSGNWHNGNNTLASDAQTPYYVAKNWGPKYLNSEGGVYKITAPLVTATQSAGNFTMGTITLAPLLANQTADTLTLNTATAFQIEEGQLAVKVDGYAEEARLIDGDVVFIPAGTGFTYYATVPATKFLYVSGGADGLDALLLEKSVEYGFASYPQYVA